MNGQLLGACRGKLLPLKPVDGRLQEPRAAGEFLSGFLASARVDHGGQVVGAQVLLDEPLGGVPHGLRAREGGVQIVEQENVDAAVEGASRCAHIRFDRLCPARRRERPLDREIDQRKGRRRLRLAVLEDLEVVSRQVSHERARLVGDDGVDLDEVGFGPERDRGLGPGPRLLRGTQGLTSQERERQDPGTAHRFSSAVP